ncbi:MAG: hypothetical protein UW34_C0012G0001, partial [Parcubacteria group bacterium GW2011_GWA2_44_15]
GIPFFYFISSFHIKLNCRPGLHQEGSEISTYTIEVTDPKVNLAVDK